VTRLLDVKTSYFPASASSFHVVRLEDFLSHATFFSVPSRGSKSYHDEGNKDIQRCLNFLLPETARVFPTDVAFCLDFFFFGWERAEKLVGRLEAIFVYLLRR
jgi:hypothetical protein